MPSTNTIDKRLPLRGKREEHLSQPSLLLFSSQSSVMMANITTTKYHKYPPPSPKGASRVITSHFELGFTRDTTYMVIFTLQQIIDERISFLKEQINQDNKPEINKTFQLQIDAIRSIDDMEKVESIILQKKSLLKNSKDVHESDRLFAELDGLEWLQRQIARYS
jgi:hypothetical protein